MIYLPKGLDIDLPTSVKGFMPNPAQKTLIATVPGTLPGVSFNVVLATSEGKALVEFYDTRFPHTEYGQFVSRYYVESIQNCHNGLDLDGGIPAWKVSGAGMATVLKRLADK